jgi:hypothetical protein
VPQLMFSVIKVEREAFAFNGKPKKKCGMLTKKDKHILHALQPQLLVIFLSLHFAGNGLVSCCGRYIRRDPVFASAEISSDMFPIIQLGRSILSDAVLFHI